MSMILEQIKRLRQKAELFRKSGYSTDGIVKEFEDAADTIEELSAKLHNSQMERSSQYYNGGWIPCSERLPENGKRVLTTIKTNKRPAKVRSGTYDQKMFQNDNGDYWDYDEKEVLAWMPLPEPFKKSEETNNETEY